MTDEFSALYADHLDASYDCVDRFVLNAYVPLLNSPGGFRTWWRQFHGGDDTLDNAHLMRFAGRFSRRLEAYARKNRIPLIRCENGERKHEIAEKYLPSDPAHVGVFCILVARAPAPVWNVRRFGLRGLNLEKKTPYVNQYAFHLIDPEWGHVQIKLCPHPPFTAQIILNGHEYVALQAQKCGIHFVKEGNCFTEVTNAAGLAGVAETLSAPRSIGRLVQTCERWIYSTCLCFALDRPEQERTEFRYEYSVYQAEYSRNFLFKAPAEMEQVFHGVIDRTRAPLQINTVRTIFGYDSRQARRKTKAPLRQEVVVERPEYDLTIFKIHFKRLTVKIYTKGERVLRIEAIAHNTEDLRCGKRIDRLVEITARLKAMVERFLAVLRCVDASFIDGDTLDAWSQPTRLRASRVAGIDVNKRRMRAVMEAVLALSTHLSGFSLADLSAKVREILGPGSESYGVRQASYDLKKFRAKGLIEKVDGSRAYRPNSNGLRAVCAMIVLREKVIKPLLSAASMTSPVPPPANRSVLEDRYDCIRNEMRQLFKTLGIAS